MGMVSIVGILELSFNGFYDPVALIPLILCVTAEGDLLLSFFYFSLGSFLHFRSLWLMGIPMVYFCEQFHRFGFGIWTRARSRWNTQSSLQLTAILIFGGSAFVAMVLLYPALREYWPKSNPALWKNLWADDNRLRIFWSCAAFPLIALALRQFSLAVVMAGVLFYVCQTPQTMSWHPLFIIPILLLAARRGSLLGFVLVSGFFYGVAKFYFGNNLFALGRFGQVYQIWIAPFF